MEKHRTRNRLQNIAIVLLSLSAVLLFARTQLVNFGSANGSLSGLLGTGAVGGGSSASLADFSAPVQLAVTTSYGSFANSYLTTADPAFSALGTLLGEAIGSAQTVTACPEPQFREALVRGGIYADFRVPLPLSVLAGLLGVSLTDNGISAQRLLLCTENGSARLYLWADATHCYFCPTPLLPDTLETALLNYQAQSASFAFEMGADYATLVPYSLFVDTLPPCNLLSAGRSLTDLDSLLRQLGFNPYTNSRYTEADGTEVIVENSRTLRVQPDGSVSYKSDDDSLKIPDSGETLSGAALGAFTLATQLLEKHTGDAALYLQSLRQEGGRTRVCFGFLVDGIPVRFADEGAAAEFELTGSTVTRFTVRYRQYSVGTQPSLLLPLRQALAIARALPGAELTIAYVDNGADSLSATWLAN